MAHKDPHSCWLPGTPQIKHVEFDLNVDFKKLVLQGRADYHFTAILGDTLKLDTRQLKVEKIEALGGNARAIRWEIGPEGPLGSELTITGVSGLDGLRIIFSTSPEAPALQWLAPQQTAGGKHPYMFSQCQAILARSVFPCQDTPSVRFTYDATIRVPKGLTAVMAAHLEGSTDEGETTVCRFRMPKPIPSYLLALAAGNIVSEKIGTRSRVFAEPEVVKQAAWEFGEVDRMLAGAESLYGEYIWGEFNLLVMPPSFPYGGMENPTLTFLTPTLIAGDRSLVSVVAHELAHSWTGNLVTNATWEDFWLNEGWTVYAERRIVEALYGSEFMALQAVNGRNDLMVSMKNFAGQEQFTKLKTDLAGMDPDDVFSSVPYEKGYLLLVEIERAVGRVAFDRFISSYISDFAFTSINTDQFVEYLRVKLPQLSGKVDVRLWIHEQGLPASAATFTSRLIDDVRAARSRWDAGERDLKTMMASWSVDQKVLFLDELPKQQSSEICCLLETAFVVEHTKNDEILLPWFCIAAGSSYKKAYPAIRDFLGVVGRGKYLKPLYRALHGNLETRPLARDWFAEFKSRYHSVARSAVQRILAS